MEDDVSTCSICVDSFDNKQRKEVRCVNCRRSCCTACILQFFDTNPAEYTPQCFHCKHLFPKETIFDFKIIKERMFKGMVMQIKEVEDTRIQSIKDRKRKQDAGYARAKEILILIHEKIRSFPYQIPSEWKPAARFILSTIAAYDVQRDDHRLELLHMLDHIRSQAEEEGEEHQEEEDLFDCSDPSISNYIQEIRAMIQSYYSIFQALHTLPEDEHTPSTKRSKISIQFPCKMADCEGIVDADTSWICSVEDSHVHCSECQEIKEGGHACHEETVMSIRQILRNSKPCPKCHIRISKIEGCDQMYCTVCYTPFSYSTGMIEYGRIHNPHYFQLLRTLSKQELEQRGIILPPEQSPDQQNGGRACLRDDILIPKLSRNLSMMYRKINHYRNPLYNMCLQRDYNDHTFIRERHQVAEGTLSGHHFQQKIYKFVVHHYKMKFFRDLWEATVLMIESLLYENVQMVESPSLDSLETIVTNLLTDVNGQFVDLMRKMKTSAMINPYIEILHFNESILYDQPHRKRPTSMKINEEQMGHVRQFISLLDGSYQPTAEEINHESDGIGWKMKIIRQRGLYCLSYLSNQRGRMTREDLHLDEPRKRIHFNPFINFREIMYHIPEICRKRQNPRLFLFTDEQVDFILSHVSTPEDYKTYGFRKEEMPFANRFLVIDQEKVKQFLSVDHLVPYKSDNICRLLSKHTYRFSKESKDLFGVGTLSLKGKINREYGWCQPKVRFPRVVLYCSERNRIRFEKDFSNLLMVVKGT